MEQDKYDIAARSMITHFGSHICLRLYDESEKIPVLVPGTARGIEIFLTVNTVAQLLRRSGLVSKEEQTKVKDSFDVAAEKLERIDPEVITITLDSKVVAGILRNGKILEPGRIEGKSKSKCVWRPKLNNSEFLVPDCTILSSNLNMPSMWVNAVKTFSCCPYCTNEIVIKDYRE